MERLIEDTKNMAIIEQKPKMEGRMLATVLALDPVKRQEFKKGEAKRAKNEIAPGRKETV